MTAEKINGFTPPENKETNQSKITVDFFFGAHENADDVEKLKSHFNNCDIYIPESAGWDEETADTYNNLSAGNITPDKVNFTSNFPEYTDAFIKLIHNSKKNILLVDQQAGPNYEQISERIENSTSDFEAIMTSFVNGNLEEAINLLRKSIEKHADLQTKREKEMIENLKGVFTEKKRAALLQKFPNLKNKKNWQVLVQLGSVHTNVFNQMKPAANEDSSLQVNRHFADRPMIYPLKSAALRSFLLKEKPSKKQPNTTPDKPAGPTDEILARMIIQNVLADRNLYNALQKFNEPEQVIIKNLISASVNLGDIKTISEKTKDHLENNLLVLKKIDDFTKIATADAETKNKKRLNLQDKTKIKTKEKTHIGIVLALQELKNLLKERGTPIPRTETEVKALLAKGKKKYGFILGKNEE